MIPLIFGLIMATFSFFWFQIVANDTVLVDQFIADLTGYAAGTAAAFLICSWWFRSHTLMLIGLAIATGVWISRAVLLFLVHTVSGFGAMSALSWALAAGLTFWIECFAVQKVDGA